MRGMAIVDLSPFNAVLERLERAADRIEAGIRKGTTNNDNNDNHNNNTNNNNIYIYIYIYICIYIHTHMKSS